MKHRVKIGCIALVLVLIALVAVYGAGGGVKAYAQEQDGSLLNPYQISTYTDWIKLVQYPDKHFILTADIDFEGVEYQIVGAESAGFYGSLDGNGHKLKNININVPIPGDGSVFTVVIASAGVFGFNYGTIKNLVVEDINIDIDPYNGALMVGGVAAYNAGTIENVTVSGNLKARPAGGRMYLGGIVGYNDYNIIESNFDGIVAGNCTGNYYIHIGGIAGTVYGGRIDACGAEALMQSQAAYGYVGGITGSAHNQIVINDCYFSGNIVTAYAYGGLAGLLELGGRISNSYAIGSASGSTAATLYNGGLVGHIKTSSQLFNCYTSLVDNTSALKYGYVAGAVELSSVRNCYYSPLMVKSGKSAISSGSGSCTEIDVSEEEQAKEFLRNIHKNECYNSNNEYCFAIYNGAVALSRQSFTDKSKLTLYRGGSAYDKALYMDVPIKMSLLAEGPLGITGGDIQQNDYEINGNFLVLKKEYLMQLPISVAPIYFAFTDANSTQYVFFVTISDTRPAEVLSDSTVYIDKANMADAGFTLELFGNQFSMAYGGELAEEDYDFDTESGTFTIFEDYLLNLQPNLYEYNIVINMRSTIKVYVSLSDTRPPTAEESNIDFDKATAQDISFFINLYNNTFDKLTGNDITSADYEFDGEELVISGLFLLGLLNGVCQFEFITDNNVIQLFVNVFGEQILVEDIVFTNMPSVMYRRETVVLNYSILPQDATFAAVTISTTTPSILQINGNSIKAIAVGDASIFVESIDGNCCYEYNFLVKNTTITLSPISEDFIMGDTLSVSATIEGVLYINTLFEILDSVGDVWLYQYVTGANPSAEFITAHKATGEYTLRATLFLNNGEKVYDLIYLTLANRVSMVQMLNKQAQLFVEDTFNVQAVVYPNNATNKKVYYYSSNPTVAMVDAQGEVVGLGAGTTTISVVSEDGGYSDEYELTVEDAHAWIDNIDNGQIFYSGHQVRINIDYIGLNYTGFGLLIKNQSNDIVFEKELSAGTLSTVWATGTLVGGVYTLTIVTYLKSKKIEDSITVTLIKQVESLSVPIKSYTLFVNESRQIEALAYPLDADNTVLAFSSSHPEIAVVDSKGRINAVKSGSAVVTVSSTDGTNLSAEIAIIVKDAYINILTPSVGDEFFADSIIDIATKIEGDNFVDAFVYIKLDNIALWTLPLSLSSQSVAWDTNQLNIDGGIYVVEAVLVLQGGVKVSDSVEVSISRVAAAVSLNREKISIETTTKFQLIGQILPLNSTDKRVGWQSADNNIARVDQNGLVTGYRKGTTTITVYSIANPEAKKSCEVTVYYVDAGVDTVFADIHYTGRGKTTALESLSHINGNVYERIEVVVENSKLQSIARGDISKANLKYIWDTTNVIGGKYHFYTIAYLFNGLENVQVKSKYVYCDLVKLTESVTISGGTVKKTGYDIFRKNIVNNSQFIKVEAGDSVFLNWEVLHSNADDISVKWVSSNPNIATVEDGVVNMVTNGQVTITAYTTDSKDDLVRVMHQIKLEGYYPTITLVEGGLYNHIQKDVVSKAVVEGNNFVSTTITVKDPYNRLIHTEELLGNNLIYPWQAIDGGMDGNYKVCAALKVNDNVTLYHEIEVGVIVPIERVEVRLDNDRDTFYPGEIVAVYIKYYPSNATYKMTEAVGDDNHILKNIEKSEKYCSFNEYKRKSYFEDGYYIDKIHFLIMSKGSFGLSATPNPIISRSNIDYAYENFNDFSDLTTLFRITINASSAKALYSYVNDFSFSNWNNSLSFDLHKLIDIDKLNLEFPKFEMFKLQMEFKLSVSYNFQKEELEVKGVLGSSDPAEDFTEVKNAYKNFMQKKEFISVNKMYETLKENNFKVSVGGYFKAGIPITQILRERNNGKAQVNSALLANINVLKDYMYFLEFGVFSKIQYTPFRLGAEISIGFVPVYVETGVVLTAELETGIRFEYDAAISHFSVSVLSSKISGKVECYVSGGIGIRAASMGIKASIGVKLEIENEFILFEDADSILSSKTKSTLTLNAKVAFYINIDCFIFKIKYEKIMCNLLNLEIIIEEKTDLINSLSNIAFDSIINELESENFDWSALEYEIMGRDYAIFDSNFVANDYILSDNAAEKLYNNAMEAILNTSVVDNVFIQNIFEDNSAQLINLTDGRQMLVWVDDARERSDANRSALYFSICENGVWSYPQRVLDDGTADFFPSLVENSGNIYLAYFNAAQVFEEDADIDEMLGGIGLDLLVYDEIERSFAYEQTLVPFVGGLALDTIFISGGAGQMSYSWASIPGVDFSAQEQANIYIISCNNGIWSLVPTQISDLNFINSIDAAYEGNNVYVVYTMNSEGEIFEEGEVIPNTTAEEIYMVRITPAGQVAHSRLTDNEITETATKFVKNTSGGYDLYFISDGVLYTTTNLTLADIIALDNGFNEHNTVEITQLSSYQICYNAIGDKVIYYMGAQGDYQYLAAMFYDVQLGCFSESVIILSAEHIQDPMMYIDNEGLISLTYLSMRTVSGIEVYDLHYVVISKTADITLVDATAYLVDDYEITLEISNTGYATIDGVVIEYYADGVLVYTGFDSCVLTPGQGTDIESILQAQLLVDCSELMIKVIPAAYPQGDFAFNTFYIDLIEKYMLLETISTLQEAGELTAIVNVTNYTLEDIYDYGVTLTFKDGTLLETFTISYLPLGESVQLQFQLPFSDWEFENDFIVLDIIGGADSDWFAYDTCIAYAPCTFNNFELASSSQSMEGIVFMVSDNYSAQDSCAEATLYVSIYDSRMVLLDTYDINITNQGFDRKAYTLTFGQPYSGYISVVAYIKDAQDVLLSKTLRFNISEQRVSVQSVKLNADDLVLRIGQSYALLETVLPINASEKQAVWGSSDEGVVMVSANGIITAQGYGTAIIFVEIGGIRAECNATVERFIVTVNASTYTLRYNIGDLFSINDLEITVDYDDGSTLTVADYDFTSDYIHNKSGAYTLCVTYKGFLLNIEIINNYPFDVQERLEVAQRLQNVFTISPEQNNLASQEGACADNVVDLAADNLIAQNVLEIDDTEHSAKQMAIDFVLIAIAIMIMVAARRKYAKE